MPTFSRPSYTNRKQTIRIKLQTPSGEKYEADVLANERLKDLTQDFYEFIGRQENIDQVRVRLIDPISLVRTAILNMDSLIGDLGVQNGDSLLFINDDDIITGENDFSMEFAPDKTLKILIPFPSNLTVGKYLNYSNNFLRGSDFIYSIFSIFQSEDVQLIETLQKVLINKPELLTNQEHLYNILRIGNNKPLEMLKIHYGSPLMIDLGGLWKPLELLRDIINDVRSARHKKEMEKHEEKMAKHEEKMARHEEKMAKYEETRVQLEIAEKYIDLANKAKLRMPKDSKSKVLLSLVPELARIDAVIVSSSIESRPKQLQSPSQKSRKFQNG